MKGINLVSKPKAKPNSIVKTGSKRNLDPEDDLVNDPDRSESDGPEDTDPTPKKSPYTQMQIE